MTALVTYIYPKSMKYFDAFCQSILNQTYKDFEVIFFNDAVDQSIFENLPFKNRFINVEGTPLEIRFKSLELLKNLSFEKIVFLDSDDSMSDNRLDVLNSKLDSYDLVCNDLDLISENGDCLESGIWSNRLKNDFNFDYRFIKYINIVGLGNTAIQKSVLNVPILFSSKPLVADWFIFYQLIKNGKIICNFTSECQTFYRQHENNDVGIRAVTNERIQFSKKVSLKQFEALNEIGIDEKDLFSFKYKSNYSKISNDFPFWWEEIYINDEENKN